jgi:RsiW-degrading membrane proteinase PrsW (M82 family)
MTASRRASLRMVDDPPNLLVNLVAEWLVESGPLLARLAAAPKHSRAFWMPRERGVFAPVGVRAAWRVVQWLIVGVLLTVLTLISLHWVIYPLIGGILRRITS